MLGNILAASTKSTPSGFSSTTLIFIVVIIAAVYLLMIRPQQRRRQQAAQRQNSVQPGARVRTTAGMYATVVDVDGDDVVLEVAPGVEVRYMKRAIMDVVSPGTGTEGDSFAATGATAGESGDIVEPDETVAGESAADAGESAYEQATGTTKD